MTKLKTINEIRFKDLDYRLQNIIIFTFLLAIICFIFLLCNIFDINNIYLKVNNLSKEVVKTNCYNQTTLSDGKIIDIKVICGNEENEKTK